MPDEKKDRGLEGYLDIALKACLYLLAFAAPVSIAAAQIAWAFALLFWIVRFFVVRPRPPKQAIDFAILAFIGLSILSAVFSYEPRVSIGKLVGVSLVTIVYLVSEYVRNLTTVRRMMGLLLIAAAVSAFWAIGVFAVGKNLKILRLTPESPLRITQPYPVQDGDTILTANGKKVSSIDDLNAAGDGHLKLMVFRYEWVFQADVPGPHADLGIVEWSRGRDARATGFFGHYTTYAEALQLLLSLAIGLMLASPGNLLGRWRIIFAGLCVLFISALFLTVTRASWAGALLSAGVITLIAARKRTIVVLAPLVVVLAAGGLWYLSQKRNVGFIDPNDLSTTWRTTVWREAFGVITSSPRNLALGVGMDAVKTHWPEWHMFENGYLPLGHMHSDYVAFAFERGVFALIAWLAWMLIYLRMLWHGIRSSTIGWPERGLLLGAFGGTIGFMTAGLVHYNWGDSEVVQIFFVIMGLSLAVLRSIPDEKTADAQLSL
ncbi:MAG TPA: O-antigen ligase family protein [Pyrinomonadaceae bacterium]|nr:O-antigen ligase family protein [Pyrinomonadaceae bacterium]